MAYNTVDTTQSLNAADLDFSARSGFDLSLNRRLTSQRTIELRYFEFDKWSARGSTATTSGDLLRFNAAEPIFATAGSSISSAFDSKLLNTELNLLGKDRGFFRGLVGLRYLELDEQSNLSLVGAGVPYTLSTRTANRLYGVQSGLIAKLIERNNWNLDLVGKSGLFGNAHSQSSLSASGGGSLSATGDRSDVAFVTELGLTGVGRLTERISIRGGYRLLWIDDVALASDQLASTSFVSGTGINSNGDAFYQGGYLGLALDF